MPVLEFQDISFSYNGIKKVINNLSFKINEGEYISVVGHNGSGKSTIAKLSIGLLKTNEGKIIVDGTELNDKNISKIRQNIALVFQNPDNQFIGSTVEEDIAFGLENRNVDSKHMHELVTEYADKVGMSEFLSKEPSTLSGGQKQRVAIAGALVLQPKILILDEATSMLDPEGKNEINKLISDMRKSNPKLVIISITHDIEEAMKSDKLLVISKGELVAFDAPKNLLKDENNLQKWHISMPFAYKIQNKLSSINIKINVEDSIKEIAKSIWQSK